MKVGFLCPHNHLDRNSFSGTAFYMWKALSARDDVSMVSLTNRRPPATSIAQRVRQRFSKPPKTATLDHSKIDGCDVILAPVAVYLIAQLPDDTPPVVYTTDATPTFLREAYGADIPLSKNTEEGQVVARSAVSVYSSAFMAERAKVEFAAFDLPPITVQPFGLNLDVIPATPAAKTPRAPLEVLIIAQDWHRKGGDIAVDAVAKLRASGVDARLTCIGAAPDEKLPAWVKHLGYLNKNDPAEAKAFAAALTRAHVFLLPTRADCTPMVVAEANAYGCPVVIRNTGGIATLMDPPRNGVLVPEDGTAQDFAEGLAQIANTADYDALSRSSHAHCVNNLTWEAWADGMVTQLRRAVEQKGAA